MTEPVAAGAAPQALLDVPFDRWQEVLGLTSKEAYRVRQVQSWVFERKARSFEEMTDLPADRRARWAKDITLRTAVLDRRDTSTLDGTSRFFFTARDGHPFSTVSLPALGAEESDRISLCLSTQVGCAWGCVFCASGKVPFARNLTTSEILEQVFETERSLGRRAQSLLFMGMGEPLANYENLRAALGAIRSPLGLNLGARHVTVSTSGVVPAILKLAKEGPRVNLAVSLHAADDGTRKMILPKSAAWTIKELLRAAWEYQKQAGGGGPVTFEYILLAGVNDSVREAQRLSNLLRGKRAWVNLIAYNPVPGLPYKAPTEETVKAFAHVLESRAIFVRVRKPQGRDIAAGCGQLGAPRPVEMLK